jgi:hypothetical protein
VRAFESGLWYSGYRDCVLRGLVLGGGFGMWEGCSVCVGSTNSVVRGSVGRCPDGGVQVSSGGE